MKNWTNPDFRKKPEYRLKQSLAHKGKDPVNRINLYTPELNESRRQKLINEKNYNWRGNKVSYDGLHHWVYRHLGKPETCEHCGKTGLTKRKIHWANKSHKYLRDLTDWLRLCVPCHSKYDSQF